MHSRRGPLLPKEFDYWEEHIYFGVKAIYGYIWRNKEHIINKKKNIDEKIQKLLTEALNNSLMHINAKELLEEKEIITDDFLKGAREYVIELFVIEPESKDLLKVLNNNLLEKIYDAAIIILCDRYYNIYRGCHNGDADLDDETIFNPKDKKFYCKRCYQKLKNI